jgi:uncharacterized protein YbjT (DUF2867 family)
LASQPELPTPNGGTYFITGAYGFLGQYIVQVISQHDPGAALRLLVRRKRRLYLPIDRLPQVNLVQGTDNPKLPPGAGWRAHYHP